MAGNTISIGLYRLKKTLHKPKMKCILSAPPETFPDHLNLLYCKAPVITGWVSMLVTLLM